MLSLTVPTPRHRTRRRIVKVGHCFDLTEFEQELASFRQANDDDLYDSLERMFHALYPELRLDTSVIANDVFEMEQFEDLPAADGNSASNMALGWDCGTDSVLAAIGANEAAGTLPQLSLPPHPLTSTSPTSHQVRCFPTSAPSGSLPSVPSLKPASGTSPQVQKSSCTNKCTKATPASLKELNSGCFPFSETPGPLVSLHDL